MSYYDRLVADPEATLDAIAEKRGDSRETLAARLTEIRAAAADGPHLSLAQAQRFNEDASARPPDCDSHVQSCGYCKALINGLESAAIDRTLRTALERIRAGAAEQPIAAPQSNDSVPKSRGGVMVGGVLAATLVVGFAIGMVTSNIVQLSEPPYATPVAMDVDVPTTALTDTQDRLKLILDELADSSRASTASLDASWVVVNSDIDGERPTITLRGTADPSLFDEVTFEPGSDVVLLDSMAVTEAVRAVDRAQLETANPLRD